MSQPENPLDVFRRTTAATVRAIAERDDINVTYAPRGQGLVGKEVKVTLPARSLPPEDAALVRGEADAAALRLRHHNGALDPYAHLALLALALLLRHFDCADDLAVDPNRKLRRIRAGRAVALRKDAQNVLAVDREAMRRMDRLRHGQPSNVVIHIAVVDGLLDVAALDFQAALLGRLVAQQRRLGDGRHDPRERHQDRRRAAGHLAAG